MSHEEVKKGPIAWMAKHTVSSNLLMLVLLLGGLAATFIIKQEVFPNFDIDRVSITVAYPGASPEEVEKSIVLAIEESVEGLDGVKEVESRAGEGVGSVMVEKELGYDLNKLAQDIQREVDRITSFPEETEEPQVTVPERKRNVVSLLVYGGDSPVVLRQIVEQVRETLLHDKNITKIDLNGAEQFEIGIELSQQDMRRYGLTLDKVASIVRRSSLELPGGSVKTGSGEVLVRMDERRDFGEEFARIPLITGNDGAEVLLGDVAKIKDGFSESDSYATFNGKRAIKLEVYRVGAQTPIGVAAAVRENVGRLNKELPPGFGISIANDQSEVYQQRFELMMRNGIIGLLLVIVLLGIFLEVRLAFWVTMGIPISFLGAILILPFFGMSINLVSMFAFIISLGIVVDDAIVVGENVYKYHEKGMSFGKAAIAGAREVSVPVIFSVLTNVVAFLPMAFVPGVMGKIFIVIPMVVITTFLISLVESLLILPAHLGHRSKAIDFFTSNLKYIVLIPAVIWISLETSFGFDTLSGAVGLDSPMLVFFLIITPSLVSIGLDIAFGRNRKTVGTHLHHLQQRFSNWFTRMIRIFYGPVLDFTLRWRYVTIAVALFILIVTVGFVKSGRLGFVTFPKMEQDYAVTSVSLPYGSPLAKVEDVRDQIVDAAQRVIDANGGDTLSRGVFAWIGASFGQDSTRDSGSHVVRIWTYLTPPDVRPLTTAAFVDRWKEEIGDLVGIDMIRSESDAGGPGSGAALTIELSHSNLDELEKASEELAAALTKYPNVRDIDDGFSQGKPQLDFKVTPEGRSLGLRARDVADQVRHALYGAEVLRQQRGRNELKVMVRRAKSERISEHDLENFIILTPEGGEVPLSTVVSIKRGRAYTSIRRRTGRRVVTVSADVVPQKDTQKVLADVRQTIIPNLTADYPGLTYSFEGKQADIRESMSGLMMGLGIAVLVIFVMLAIPLDSYVQPLIIMFSIPFGIVGAIAGHIVMDYSLSIMSMFGIVALSGVVVNDSLVLIDFANRARKDGVEVHWAIHSAGIHRFRAIMLTTMSTFFGLMPMIFETSRQARFLIPMALSLGFGILFATFITLVIVPSLYIITEDFLHGVRKVSGQ